MMNTFQAIIEQSNTGVYVTRVASHELLYINETALKWGKLFGIDYKGKTCHKLFNDSDTPCTFCRLHELKQGEHSVREFTNPKYGKTFEMTGSLIEWCGEEAHIEYIRDITEKNHIEEENKQISRKIVEQIPCGIVVYAYDGKTITPLHHNEHFFDILGYSEEHRNLVKHAVYDANVHPEDNDLLWKTIHHWLQIGGVHQHTYRIFNDKKGHYIYLKLTANIVQHTDGTATVYAQYEDITETVESKIDLQMMNDTMQSAFVKCSAKAGFPILFHSHLFLSMDGHTEADLHEKFQNKLINYVREDERESFTQTLLSCEVGEVKEIKYHEVKPHGTQTFLAKAIMHKDSNDEKELFITFVDITEMERGQKKNLSALRAFEELEYDMYTDESNLIGMVKMNISKSCVIDHKPYGMPVPIFPNETSLETFLKMLTKTAIGTGEVERFQAIYNVENVRRASQTGTSLSHEYQRLNKYGQKIWARSILKCLDYPIHGEYYGLGYTYDITNERELSRITNHIINSNFDLVAVLDIESDIAVTTLSSDQGALLQTKEEREKYGIQPRWPYTLGLHYFSNTYALEGEAEEMCRVMEIPYLIQQLERKTSHHCTFTIWENGEKRRKHWQFSYLNHDTSKIIYSRSDITDIYQKELQAKEALRLALEKSKEASVEKTAFLARMSHDMRTPMNAILGFADIGLQEAPTPDQCIYFNHIKESGQYLLGLINDVLDMGKIEEGKLKLHPEPYDYPDFEQCMRNMLQPKAEEKGVDLRILNERPIDAMVEFDKMRLQQIFVNLIGNAIKFTPTGGFVECRLDVGQPDQNGHVPHTITIRDNGIGMSEDFIKNRLFVAFEQEHSDIIANETGTGLGVTIAKRLIELMGGSIHCESSLGKGTTFTIQLFPKMVQMPRPSKAKTTQVSAEILQGKRILLCEDHALNVKLAKKLLESVGMSVVAAEHGQIGVETFCAHEAGYFDAILMDIRMPVMDGLTTSATIRKLDRPDAKTIPIIAMSANAFVEDVEKSISVGMNAHLSKPIQTNALYSTLCTEIKKRGMSTHEQSEQKR